MLQVDHSNSSISYGLDLCVQFSRLFSFLTYGFWNL